MRKSKKIFWLFLAPCLITFCIAVVIPTITGIYYSFTDWEGLHSNCDFVFLDNYISAFHDIYFQNAFVFTFKFVIITVIAVNAVAFATAMLVTQNIKGKNLFRSIFFMPNLVGGVLVGFAWQFIFCDVFDSVGELLGINWLCDWLSTKSTGFWGLVILVVWQMSGYMMLIYIAQIQNIPENLLESARIDGASSFQCFWKIKLPLMMPAFTIGLFLTLTNCFKLYDQNLTLTGGGPAKSTEMLTMDICNTAFSRNMYGMAQAKGIIFLVVVALITVSQLMFTKSKEVEM